jgi:hypothetical protein
VVPGKSICMDLQGIADRACTAYDPTKLQTTFVLLLSHLRAIAFPSSCFDDTDVHLSEVCWDAT